VGYRGTGGARRVTVGLAIHLLRKFTTILVVVISPFEGIYNFAASLTSVLVAGVVVHRNAAGVGVTPLPSVDDDVPRDETFEKALVEITMGVLTEMVCHLALAEATVVDGILKNLGQLGFLGLTLTLIGDVVSDEAPRVLFLGEVTDDGMLFHIVHIRHQLVVGVTVEVVTATATVGHWDVVIWLDVSNIVGDYCGHFAELTFTGFARNNLFC
jgi:hypothetical protein